METKNVTIKFHRLSGGEGSSFMAEPHGLVTMAERELFGTFGGRKGEIFFKLFEVDGDKALVALARQKALCPLWWNEAGEINEAPTEGGKLGDYSYYLYDAEPFTVSVLSGGIGSPSISDFTDFVRWITGDPSVDATPVIHPAAISTVKGWEIYSKVAVTFKARTADEVESLLDSPEGGVTDLLGWLKGRNITQTVSGGRNRPLDKNEVRKMIDDFTKSSFVTSLKISGKNFEEEKTEEIDLYAAIVRCKDEIEVAGKYITPDEAKAALQGAYDLYLDLLETA